MAAGMLALLSVGIAAGGIAEFSDRDEWIAAVGQFTTADFTGFPQGTFLTDQYADLGVQFTDADDTILVSRTAFPNDGVGLNGNGDITVAFASPQVWIGVDFPSYLNIELYRDAQLIHSGVFGFGGPDNFGGLISSELFDVAVLIDPLGQADIDDLHFAPPCFGELNSDGIVGLPDFLMLLSVWGTPDGDVDGDGTTGIGDFLTVLGNWGPCPYFVDCNGNGVFDLIDVDTGNSLDCNTNAVPDDCDIARGISTDFNGNDIPDDCEPPANDECEDALEISDGATSFLTVAASTGGPPAICAFDTLTFHNDIWFLYEAPCTGFATLSLCNDANFDTLMAVYSAGSCLSFNPLVCNDDAPGCSATSEIQQFVVETAQYRVRIGGTTDGGGFGLLTISCEPSP